MPEYPIIEELYTNWQQATLYAVAGWFSTIDFHAAGETGGEQAIAIGGFLKMYGGRIIGMTTDLYGMAMIEGGMINGRFLSLGKIYVLSPLNLEEFDPVQINVGINGKLWTGEWHLPNDTSRRGKVELTITPATGNADGLAMSGLDQENPDWTDWERVKRPFLQK